MSTITKKLNKQFRRAKDWEKEGKAQLIDDIRPQHHEAVLDLNKKDTNELKL